MKGPRTSAGDGPGRLARGIAERKGGIVHLTHNDLDAVGADAIHRLAFGDVFTIYSSVGQFVRNLETVASVPGRGDLLSISDLGARGEAMGALLRAKENGWRIEWRDHHRWRDADLTAAAAIADYLQVDTATCACGIVARDLLPENVQAEEIARVVCDYDLWRHEDPRSAVLGRVASDRDHREAVRDALISGEIISGRIREANAAIEAELERAIEQSIRHATVRTGRYRIIFAPMYGYPSETAAAIRERLGSDIEVLVGPKGRFSIRSAPPVSHLIAGEFNGGGHPNAAGGRFPFNVLDRFLFWLTSRSRFFSDLERVADAIA